MATSTRARNPIVRYGAALVAAGIPFVLYVATLFPGVGDRSGTGDAIEFQYVGRILGVAHEPGYPQYVALSHLWTALPIPLELAAQVNLLSAVFTGLAALLFFLSLGGLGIRETTSVLVTLTLFSALDIWLLATQAEVYSLNLLWVSAVLWVASRWDRTGRQRDLELLFVLFALSFGNHLTMILLLPGLVILVLWRDPRAVTRWRTWLAAMLAIAAGLLQYGLLWWRSYHPHPALPPWFPRRASVAELWAYVSGDRFVDKHWLKTGPGQWPRHLWETLEHGVEQLSIVLFLLAAVGLWVGFRHRNRLAVVWAAIAFCVLGFAAGYQIKDSAYYAIPAWVCVAMFGALGLDLVLERLAARQRRLLLAVLVALLGARLASGVARLRTDETPADLRASIAAAGPDAGILVGRRARQARLADGYYRYGLGLDKVARLSFHATAQVFEHGVEASDGVALYFQSHQVRSELEERWVDYRRASTSATEPEVWVTGTDRPIETIRLRSLWNHNLALSIRERSQDLLGERTLHLVVIEETQRRSKGHATFVVTQRPKWQREIRAALSVAAPGDWMLLVEPAVSDATRTTVDALLRAEGVEPDPTPFRYQRVAFWQKGRAAASAVRARDLEGELDLVLGPIRAAPAVN